MNKKTETVELGFFEPQIHFSYSQMETWRRRGVKLTDLAKELNDLRIRMKEAAGYFWDNSHFYVDDIYGKPAISFLVRDDGIDMWEANHGTSLGDFAEIPEDIARIINDHIAVGEVKCSEDGEWVKEFKRFSYTGAVCVKHFDPVRHKGPDSSG